jgi:crotonobetainyl-CoA:carnitine CoA-transferase CaiB-like acyl-CoA transferase
MAKADNEARLDAHGEEAAALREIVRTRTADEWEAFLQARHVPAARVRTTAEAMADPHLAARPNLLHRFPDGAPGVEGAFGVPVAALGLAHGGPRVDTPPPRLGADTDAVLAELGYAPGDVAALRAAGAV